MDHNLLQNAAPATVENNPSTIRLALIKKKKIVYLTGGYPVKTDFIVNHYQHCSCTLQLNFAKREKETI